MAIDDELEISLAQLANSAEADPGHEVINIAIKMIPIVGSGIDKLMSDLAQRRLVERILDVFGQMKSQLYVLMEDQIRKEYFTSEEFQTLLALALQEIQTTPDRKKLEMIAAALCNSGKVQFQAETRKELFVRVLRSLSPEHIGIIHSLAPVVLSDPDLSRMRSSGMDWSSQGDFVTEDGEGIALYYPLKPGNNPKNLYPIIRAPKGEQLLLLQNLASHGLVEETFAFPQSAGPEKQLPLSEINEETLGKQQTKALVEKMRQFRKSSAPLPKPPALPIRCFRMSRFGEQFVVFVTKKS